MSKSNRDLLILSKLESASFEKELEALNNILFDAERLDNFVSAHELIDLYKYQITRKPFEIKKTIRSKKEESFVFLNNLN